MKNKLILLGTVLMAGIILCSCGKENSLSVKEDIIRMKTDESYTIKVTQTNEEQLTWHSADTAIATVSPEGTVTAMGNGITTITAQTEDKYIHVGVIVGGDEGYVDNNGNYVQVFDGISDITEIVVGVRGGGKDDITVKVGDVLKLSAYITPSDSQDPIVWQSDDTAIARVKDDGTLEAVNKGITTITAYAPNGVNGKLIVRCK